MLRKLLKLLKKDFQPLNLIEVSKANLIHNYKYLSSLNEQSSRATRTSEVKVAAVVKSNGYGHGIINVAKILEPLDPPFFCVDSLFEAYQLQKSGIKIPILITGYTNPENLKVKKLLFSFAVYTKDLLETISKYQTQAGVHIFVDTGMRREGVTLEDLPEFLEDVKKLNIKVEGLMSHLASSNSKNDPLFLNQIKQFKKALEIIRRDKINPRWIHIAATGSIINPQTRPIISEISNMVRAGLSLYGFSSSTPDQNLKPTLKLISHISQIKILKKGERVGYDGTYKANIDTIIGVLPIGYYDGVVRGLSNLGFVKMGSNFCPIIGRVSMNLTTVDISKMKNPKIGDEVLVYSDNPKDINSIENTARICHKIPYEILVNLAESTRRVVI